MQFVADNYPNKEEGKKAQDVLTNQIPYLEKIDFESADTNNWKILYKVASREDESTKKLEGKLKKFIAVRNV